MVKTTQPYKAGERKVLAYTSSATAGPKTEEQAAN